MAKNSKLKQGTHRGRTVPRTPKSRLAVVPASITTLPPGLGPPNSAGSVSGVSGLGNKRKRKITSHPLSGSSTVRISNLAPGGGQAYGGTTIWKASPVFRMSDVKRVVSSGGSASLRGRARRAH